MMSTKNLFAAIACAVLVSGCRATDSTDAAPLVSVEPGIYKMVTINDAGLPANVSDGQSPLWVNSGSLTIEASGKYTIEVSYQRFIGETYTPVTDTCSGSYTRTRTGLEFQEAGPCNGAYGASVQNGILTVWLGPNLKVEYRMKRRAPGGGAVNA